MRLDAGLADWFDYLVAKEEEMDRLMQINRDLLQNVVVQQQLQQLLDVAH